MLFVALIFLAFYWICKGINRFVLTKKKTASDATADARPAKRRLKSIDIFRGISIVVMIFVNSGGGRYWWIDHAIWNGLQIADLVFPWFLFIMGVCIPLSITSQIYRGIPANEIIKKITSVSQNYQPTSNDNLKIYFAAFDHSLPSRFVPEHGMGSDICRLEIVRRFATFWYRILLRRYFECCFSATTTCSGYTISKDLSGYHNVVEAVGSYFCGLVDSSFSCLWPESTFV